jgi:disulfide bond formation protein DsbB
MLREHAHWKFEIYLDAYNKFHQLVNTLTMDFIIADIFFSLLGRTILFLQYRDATKVRRELVDKYNNSYSQAGRLLGTLSIAGTLLIAFIVLFLAVFYGVLRHNLDLF